MNEDQLERFMSKVDKNGPEHPYDKDLGRCWLWIGGRGITIDEDGSIDSHLPEDSKTIP